MDDFISEHNVDIYLLKLGENDDAKLQDTLLQLLRAELTGMPRSQLHLEKGQRRLAEVKERFRRQVDTLDRLRANGETVDREVRLLEILGKVRELFETHCLRQAGGKSAVPGHGKDTSASSPRSLSR